MSAPIVRSPRYDRILSIDFYDNRQMVMSVLESGYSDIYLYDIKTKGAKQITKDYHDDLDPAFVKINGRKGIAFSSNRSDSLLMTEKIDSILPITNFDIWYFDLETKDLKELVRITNTPLVNESHLVKGADVNESRRLDALDRAVSRSIGGVFNCTTKQAPGHPSSPLS